MIPSLPDARRPTARFRCGGLESYSLAAMSGHHSIPGGVTVSVSHTTWQQAENNP